MPRILAIEADSARKRRLATLVREQVHAELTVVDSVDEAILALASFSPDVVLVPSLLAPQDELALMTRIRHLPSPHVQTLTIPVLELAEAPQQPERRFRLRQRRTAADVRFDPHLAAARIAAGLERARVVREEHERARACGLDSHTGSPQSLVSTATTAAARAAVAVETDERRRARRIIPAELPWLSAVRTPWGLDLDLLNISSTGLLVESTSKLSQGVTYEMQLQGPDTALLVRARVVRSDVGRVDTRGVRYHAAASFERALDLLGRRGAAAPADPQQALAELLLKVVADAGETLEPADVRFARGLRRLLGARDVLVRRAPVSPADGSESIYFHVTGQGRTQRILQVLFDPDRALTEAEFRLLKAAAPMTAAVLELDRRPPPEPMAIVA